LKSAIGDQAVDPRRGRVRVRVAAPTALDIARRLACWGTLLDVLDPPEVRHHLAGIGARLATRYG
jgi:hypothetical protein